jgi:D-alanyl-D-alanine carboxypeptidase/D-alanyl-D-alanine-endopeptidase (penicillin-binding protein 4)
MRRAFLMFAAAVAVLAFLPGPALADFCGSLKSRLVRGGGPASGLIVMDAESGAVICRRAASTPRPLASNMKMFTTATALARFGPEARISTKVVSDGTLGLDGVLRGSLYLRGGGDPALGTPAFYGRFLGGLGTNLFALKRQIRAEGVERVTGRLYADDTVFDRIRGVADSGYATSPWIGPLSGLAFNSGYASTSARSFSSDPARLAARKLAVALRKAGVDVPTEVAKRPAPAAAETLAVVRSPAMAKLAEATNVPSNNFFAEMLIKLLGSRFGGEGSTAAGAAVIERYARGHGVAVQAVDGSGLTRSNAASPEAVAEFLRAVRNDEIGDEFIQSLALTSREGTVAGRMEGSAAEARCRTKTGTLTGISNLSGYCFNRNGKVMIFSILMGSVYSTSFAHLEQDRIAAAVAGY